MLMASMVIRVFYTKRYSSLFYENTGTHIEYTEETEICGLLLFHIKPD